MFKRYIAYIKDNPQGYWFKRRLYGWGWTPARWQGLLTLLVYLAAVLFFTLTIDPASSDREVMFTFLLPLILLTATLIRICFLKGEAPRWTWGLPPEKK